ncbi:hypothetical protein AZE42_11204 [Rhizopogon vesiculosus]|uniref:Uncharacterized protein n=1 Tax=Rhizopogon vesiculosus TaxID=180088 RepID=A0A1J8Q744_9AGAM|nr:hypothetical protein AZE42_11204 [Rhizopogon vesiculosus]
MPDGPVDLPRLRLSGFQKKQNQWWRWSKEVIPSLITPYLTYIWQSVSLQCAPDLHSSLGDNSLCDVVGPKKISSTQEKRTKQTKQS